MAPATYTAKLVDRKTVILIMQVPLIVATMTCMPTFQVYHVRNKMDSVGLDMLLDIHGDEELPYNFINGNEVH